MNKFVVWFKDVDKEDGAIVGGKGANLGEMTRAGFPVPNGFIVTSAAYYHFLDEDNLRGKIHELLADLDVNDSQKLEHAAQKVQHLITRSPFPKNVAQDIIASYFTLSGPLKHALVAVRSSATAEDLPGASFAGQQSTFLNVQGEANVIEKVREAWASLFTGRAIFYRQTNKFDHFKVGIAVPVQKMVESEASGVMFTIDPVTNERGRVVIEAIKGLGEMIVQGMVTPDHYEVQKDNMMIVNRIIREQEKKMIKKGRVNVILKMKEEEANEQKLTDDQIKDLAELGKKLEHHYYFPQDIEWAMENGTLFIVQTRPITTVDKKVKSVPSVHINKKAFLKGDPASPGIASGKVKILHSAKEIDLVKEGDVLVAEQTNPDFVPAMKRAVAIVTERGGRTSHAAIVSRELGIPAVVGCEGALSELKDDAIISVNGSSGEIYEGAVEISASVAGAVHRTVHEKTATKVYVNLAEPSRADVVAKMDADGIGLLRAEFMIAEIGTHPRKLIEEHKEHIFIDTMAEHLAHFCNAFGERPVVYRATDFKTNEYRNLKGGEAFEPEEPNPMLGFRGAARYVADAKVFEMELEAIKKVRNEMGLKNLHMMIPFVRNPKELHEVKKIINAAGLERSHNFKLWLMCEIPTNVIRLGDFLDIGIDGVSIGSNDLTMLMLGTDRDNSEVASDFYEMDPSVMWAFERVVKTCVEYGVTCSMCGQAASDYPDLVQKLVEWGITSVSVNSDAIDTVRGVIAHAEKHVVHKR
jgi:pyruvate, water dikinase